MIAEVPLKDLSLEKVIDLLGQSDIPGSEKELAKLCIRIRELIELNGEDWVKDNSQMLLDDWDYIVQHGIIT